MQEPIEGQPERTTEFGQMIQPCLQHATTTTITVVISWTHSTPTRRVRGVQRRLFLFRLLSLPLHPHAQQRGGIATPVRSPATVACHSLMQQLATTPRSFGR
jgi:hypothetical protein